MILRGPGNYTSHCSLTYARTTHYNIVRILVCATYCAGSRGKKRRPHVLFLFSPPVVYHLIFRLYTRTCIYANHFCFWSLPKEFTYRILSVCTRRARRPNISTDVRITPNV